MGRERRHCGRFISKATGGVPRRGVGGRERERGEGKRKKSYVLPLSSSASPLSQAFFCCCCLLCRFSFGFCQATDTSQWTQGVHERSERARERERERGGGGAPLRIGGKRKKGEEENVLSL